MLMCRRGFWVREVHRADDDPAGHNRTLRRPTRWVVQCGVQREKMKKKNNSLEPHVSFPDDAAAAGRNGWIPLACHHHCPLRFLFPLATAPVALLTGRHHPARPRLLPAQVIWRPAIPSRADTTRFRFCPVVVSSFALHCRYVL